MKAEFDIGYVLNCLPHRYPFLLVDRILEIIPNEKAVALKNVTMNEPFFTGHFPELPVMPGVLIIEALAQVGGVLVVSGLPAENRGAPMYFMGIDKAKFRKPVIPGDQLVMEVSILKHRRKIVKLAGFAKVDGEVVAEAELMATIGEKK
ncbi:MAG: 3-hydroxyacyl-ACP dehydratase FabZ [Desulfobacteraceae bacterium]|nr:3-hydroxyacyl-ACP dehydratase FabZ [Desulfobacteraceae bacterium]